jgi:hypothetical protein
MIAMKKLCFRVAAVCLAAALVLGVLPLRAVYAADDGAASEQVQVESDLEQEEASLPTVLPEVEIEPSQSPSAEDVEEPAESPSEEETEEPVETPAEEDEEAAVETPSEEETEEAEDGISLQGDEVEVVETPEETETVELPSITLTNVELDIPDGVNDTFTYYVYVWTTGSDGSINAVTGTYGDLTLTKIGYTYSEAYSNGLPYSNYYNYYGLGRVYLSAGESAVITDLPEGCGYFILVASSRNYFVKSVTSTYGTANEQMGTVYVDSASGHNQIVCVNDYAPNSIRIGEEVMSSDPDSVNDEFTFTIYLYSHSSSGNTPLFEGDSVEVSISTDGTNGAEAPILGNGDTLTFTTTDEMTLPGQSVSGTYNVATIKLKHGQSIVLQNLGSNFGCYVYQTPEFHYTLYQLKFRHVYVSNMDEFVSSYDGYYQYIDSCSVSANVGFTNAQQTLSITKEVEGNDTDRQFTFYVYFTKRTLESSQFLPLSEDGEFELTYTNPVGDEPETVTPQLGTDYQKTSSYTYNGEKVTFEWSAMEIKVRAGQTVTINAIPSCYAYYVSEVPVTNYTLTDVTFSTSSSYTTLINDVDVWSQFCYSDDSITFTNTYTPPEDSVDLTISKTVTGNFADWDRAFSFTIALTDQDGEPLSDQDIEVLLPGQTETTVYTTDADGQLTVSLKDGQQVTLQDLPQGTQYTVTETDADTYSTSFSVTGGSADQPDDQTQSGALDTADDVSIQVTNDLSLAVPTGVRTETQSAVVVGGIAVGALLLLIASKVKKGKQD